MKTRVCLKYFVSDCGIMVQSHFLFSKLQVLLMIEYLHSHRGSKNFQKIVEKLFGDVSCKKLTLAV